MIIPTSSIIIQGKTGSNVHMRKSNGFYLDEAREPTTHPTQHVLWFLSYTVDGPITMSLYVPTFCRLNRQTIWFVHQNRLLQNQVDPDVYSRLLSLESSWIHPLGYLPWSSNSTWAFNRSIIWMINNDNNLNCAKGDICTLGYRTCSLL